MRSIGKCSNCNSTTSVKKENNKVKEKGSLRAYAASVLVGSVLAKPVSDVVSKGMDFANKNLSAEQVKKINDVADKVLIDSGLAKKGVKIVNAANKKVESTGNIIIDKFFNSDKSVIKGTNAYYNFVKKEIFINRDKFSAATFHEMGHAFNSQISKLANNMFKMKILMLIIPSAISLFAAFSKNAEPEDGKELTKLQKTKNFVRKNAGFIAGLSMVPYAAEEILASVRGSKLANANLPKELAKIVKMTNTGSALSYITLVVFSGLGAYTATKVKDFIMAKQKAQSEASQNNDMQTQEK